MGPKDMEIASHKSWQICLLSSLAIRVLQTVYLANMHILCHTMTHAADLLSSFLTTVAVQEV